MIQGQSLQDKLYLPGNGVDIAPGALSVCFRHLCN